MQKLERSLGVPPMDLLNTYMFTFNTTLFHDNYNCHKGRLTVELRSIFNLFSPELSHLCRSNPCYYCVVGSRITPTSQ